MGAFRFLGWVFLLQFAALLSDFAYGDVQGFTGTYEINYGSIADNIPPPGPTSDMGFPMKSSSSSQGEAIRTSLEIGSSMKMRQRVRVSQVSAAGIWPSPTIYPPPRSPTPPPPSPPPHTGHRGVWLVVGISLGVGLVIIAIAILGWYLWVHFHPQTVESGAHTSLPRSGAHTSPLVPAAAGSETSAAGSETSAAAGSGTSAAGSGTSAAGSDSAPVRDVHVDISPLLYKYPAPYTGTIYPPRPPVDLENQ